MLRSILRIKGVYYVWKRVLTFIGDLQCAFAPPKIRAEHLRKLMELTQPGDVLGRGYIWYADAIVLPGECTHTMFVKDQNTILHATSDGVWPMDILDAAKDADLFVLYRPRYEPGMAAVALSFVEGMTGLEYDFLMDKFDRSAFYCHELVHAALMAAHVAPDLDDRRFVLAEDIAQVCDVILKCP